MTAECGSEGFGGTPPEQLPTPAESIKQLKARERRLERERQPCPFPALDAPSTSDE